MPVAAVAGAAIGAGGSIGGTLIEAESQRKIASQNRDAQKQANLLNLAQYVASRGGDPTAMLRQAGLYTPEMASTLQNMGVILPAYAGGVEGEKALYNEAMAQRAAMQTMTPEQRMAELQSIIAAQQPAIEAGTKFVGDIYGGGLEQERLAALAPVEAARMEGVEANRAAIDLALRDTMNRMAAEEARKGYVGAGGYGTNRMLTSTLGARQAAAQAEAAARLQNELARQGIKESGVDMRLKSLDIPAMRAQQLAGLSMLPESSLAKLSEIQMAPLAPFRMSPGTPPSAAPLEIKPTASGLGLALSGAGQALGNAAQMYQWNQMAKQQNWQAGNQARGNAQNWSPEVKQQMSDWYEGTNTPSSFGA
jgi:hypothetical protein